MRAAPELRISGRRRNEIKKAVVELLRECEVNTLPVCLQKITEKKQWIPVEYAVARRSGLEIPSPSEDGCTIVREAENTREYIILYNEREIPAGGSDGHWPMRLGTLPWDIWNCGLGTGQRSGFWRQKPIILPKTSWPLWR